MTKKTEQRIDFICTYCVPVVCAFFWPYILAILIGLFAFLVVIGIAFRGFH